MFGIFIQGFLLQASLILALGAQNIFVLNSGLHRQRHLLVALVSSICDAILVFLGVLGLATIFIQIPLLKIIFGIVGVIFLFIYGLLKLNEARKGITTVINAKKSGSIKQTILTTIGFSLLNPHVYLDTVILIGGYSSKFSNYIERFYFGDGASMFSVLWFFGLVLLASLGNRLLNNSKAMRTISLISGAVLVILSIKLGIDVAGWIG